MKTAKLISAFLLLFVGAFGQQSALPPVFWRLTNITGYLKMEGLYKEQQIKRSGLDENEQYWLLSGGLRLNASSYFWHPNFMLFDVGVEYSPEQSKTNYQIIPDQGEVRTLKNLDLRASLFQKKFINLTAFTSMSQTNTNREYLSDIRTDSKNWGGVISLRTKILPASLQYQQGKTDQDELQTLRKFSYENSFLEGRVSQGFAKHDKIELIGSETKFRRIETSEQNDTIKNKLDEVYLNTELFFDRKQRTRFYSTMNWADQKGYDTLKRKQAFQSLSIKLPANFDLSGNYNYYQLDERLQSLKQQTTGGTLRNKLYESLYSGIYFQNIDSKQTTYTQTDTRYGVDFDYSKKIPKGQLNLSYHYMLQKLVNTGEATNVQIMQEEYVLRDGQIIFLKLPDVLLSSVNVRDASGVLFQLNIDYLLIPQGNFIQIQRVPGGLIPNNSSVFVDYVAKMPGDYQYNMKSESWSAGITLFKQLLGLYYRHVKQDYFNLQHTEFVVLNYFTQQVYGCRLEYKAFMGGVEFDDNNSTILPYHQKRYWINYQDQFSPRVLLTFNGNLSEYHLVNEDLDQEYADVSGQFAYNLSQKSKLNFELGYRQQTGAGINLKLLNARIEYSKMVRQLNLTIGVQTFRRNYLEEIDNYNGAYFRIVRRF